MNIQAVFVAVNKLDRAKDQLRYFSLVLGSCVWWCITGWCWWSIEYKIFNHWSTRFPSLNLWKIKKGGWLT